MQKSKQANSDALDEAACVIEVKMKHPPFYRTFSSLLFLDEIFYLIWTDFVIFAVRLGCLCRSSTVVVVIGLDIPKILRSKSLVGLKGFRATLPFDSAIFKGNQMVRE